MASVRPGYFVNEFELRWKIEKIFLKSRDNARTPFPWDGSEKSGFTTGQPWIDFSPDNTTINAAAALADEDSVFYHYQKLIALRRKYDVVSDGHYELINATDSDVYGYMRTLGDDKLIVICSFSDHKVTYQVPDDLFGAKLLLSNYVDRAEVLGTLELNPYEALIYLK